MNDNVRESRASVYEIGYLLAGIPEERVAAEADAIKGIVAANGGSMVAEEAPKRERLAYTMKKKMVSGAYDKYYEAYFGWVKFEASADKIEAITSAIEALEPVLRILAISTVREDTYLGKRAPAVAAAPMSYSRRPVATAEGDAMAAATKKDDAAQPATVEEMDKSIDEMVKEV